jgi:hypothetical protein
MPAAIRNVLKLFPFVHHTINQGAIIMFVNHEKILAQLTKTKQEELNGMSFDKIRRDRIKAVKKNCPALCRLCTGVSPHYVDGWCDGMLTEPERAWVGAQIQAVK